MKIAPKILHFVHRSGLFLLLVTILVGTAQAQPDTGDKNMDMKTDLLFIHHSCGGALLADPGAVTGGEKGSGNRCIYGSHPNGGGLRTLLAGAGYQVNELSYESRLGEDTDICHWRKKFATQMYRILKVEYILSGT